VAVASALVATLGCALPTAARAQQPRSEIQAAGQPAAPSAPVQSLPPWPAASAETQPRDRADGLPLPQGERFRLALRFLAGYGFDGAQATLGLEKQWRVGYAIVALLGKLDDRFSYRIEVNPVDEAEPLPACGEPDFFFPNTPQAFGPTVPCDHDGRVRVDDYRFIALDPIRQQGPLRQAYLDYVSRSVHLRMGRFILPQGFGWEEVGSFSAKDATHIQRINAVADFGLMASVTARAAGRRLASASVAVTMGEGNRFHDYDYFYWLDGSLDTNSWPALLLSGVLEPLPGLEFRGTVKRGGDTGSKVERLPNFFASKRRDNAWILSARYAPVPQVSLFGEFARYAWGLPETTADLLGLDYAPLNKDGYYFGGEASYPLSSQVTIGTVMTREELSRDDSLVQRMAQEGRYGVRLGQWERASVYRVYVDFSDLVRIWMYRNNLSNPYPWLSGIVPVSGERAFDTGRGSNRWGVNLAFQLP
jgi:hypothetical protein